jgi:hypothetical protein
MGQVVFQATLGGQVALNGPNTASSYTLNLPAISDTIATVTGSVANVTGTVAVANGGTGLTSLTSGYIPYGNGTSAFSSSSSLYFSGSNLGIGTSSPQQALCVSSSGVGLEVAPNAGGSCYLASFNRNTTDFFNLSLQSSTMYFLTGAFGSNTERMRIDASGNLLLNTTTVQNAKFTLNNASGNAQTILCGNGATGISITNQSGSAAYTLLNFFVGGVAYTGVGSITTNGTTTSYNVTSDQRLKENIVDAPSGNINDIRVRSFDWIGNGTHQTYGVIAQELLEVAPYAVHQPKNTEEMMAVDYSKLVPMMIKEIQEQQALIESLTTRLTALENK